MAASPKAPAQAGLTRVQRAVLIVLSVLLVGSAIARGVMLAQRAPSRSATDTTLAPSNYLASTRSAAQEPQSSGVIEDALPYVTEGSLFALIGFALGYTTRKIFKIGLLLLAVAFIAIQALTYAKVASVDWGGLVDWLNRAVLNLKENDTVTQFVTRRIPSTGALVAGAALGFKRG